MDDAPQPENYLDFDSFNAAYEAWLDTLSEDEIDELNAEGFDIAYTWEQYQNELD